MRSIWAESKFATLKREHNVKTVRKRGLLRAIEEALLVAITLNLKRMVKAVTLLFTTEFQGLYFSWANQFIQLHLLHLLIGRFCGFCQQVDYYPSSALFDLLVI